MKKIVLLLSAACTFFACEPTSEDFTNGGSITKEEMHAKSSVTLDKAEDGTNGNVVRCETHAAVNAKWEIGGKEYFNNFATKKLKVGEHSIVLTGRCADGTLLTDTFIVNVQTITDPLTKYWIYGEDETAQPAFVPGAWDASAMRFSDNEGQHLPFLSDEVYWGFKTLIFEVTDVTDDCVMKVMNGWWSATYYDNVNIKDNTKDGKWELQLTEDIAKDCARGNGGGGRDLDLMLYSGSMTVHKVYYEE